MQTEVKGNDLLKLPESQINDIKMPLYKSTNKFSKKEYEDLEKTHICNLFDSCCTKQQQKIKPTSSALEQYVKVEKEPKIVLAQENNQQETIPQKQYRIVEISEEQQKNSDKTFKSVQNLKLNNKKTKCSLFGKCCLNTEEQPVGEFQQVEIIKGKQEIEQNNAQEKQPQQLPINVELKVNDADEVNEQKITLKQRIQIIKNKKELEESSFTEKEFTRSEESGNAGNNENQR